MVEIARGTSSRLPKAQRLRETCYYVCWTYQRANDACEILIRKRGGRQVTNAERQKSWRQRQKAKRNAPVTAAIGTVTVTSAADPRDYYDTQGRQHIYLGEWGTGPQYALVVNSAKGD